MTFLTLRRRWLVLLRRMAALAANRHVFSVELPAIFGLRIVVIEAILSRRAVACLAVESEAAPVRVVLEVTTRVAALHRSRLVATRRMAAFAACVLVFPDERIVALIVVELGRSPARTFVTVVAGVFAERAFVQTVFVAGSAHRRSVAILIVLVARATVFDLHAVDDVTVDQLERLAGSVTNFDALADGFGIDALLHFAGLLVTLQALVRRELLLVDVGVLVAAHAVDRRRRVLLAFAGACDLDDGVEVFKLSGVFASVTCAA